MRTYILHFIVRVEVNSAAQLNTKRHVWFIISSRESLKK